MTEPNFLSRLTAYVPTPVAQAIHRHPRLITEPLAQRYPAAVLFSDISGFTALGELLSQAGPTGAEELTHLINRYFTRMIQIIEAYQGQVVKFSGDAITVIFPAEKISMQLALRQAGQCALAMQSKMRQFSNIKTSRGQTSLSMKVGIGAGQILECSIGGALGRWEYVVGGEPLVQVATAEQLARPGQIVISPEAWLEAQEFFIGIPHPDRRGYIKLYKTVTPLPEMSPTPLDWTKLNEQEQKLAEQALQCYIPGAIKARLDNQADWLAELRRMTILFIGIGGFDYEADNAKMQLQNFLQNAQEVIYHFEGSLGKITVDDKGTVLLVLFGAPPFSHEDDTSRAVACALDLQVVAQELNLHMSIGITEGPIFAGPVGSPNRREYTVIGDEVNLAARLMQYGRAGMIIVSERVQDRAGPKFMTENLGPITVRGKTNSPTAYLVKGKQGSQDKTVARYLLHKDPLIGRKAELEQTRRMANRARSGKLQILFIEGELGLGKSRLAAEMVQEWTKEGNIAHGGKFISYDKQIPYQGWREIITGILGLNSSTSAREQLSQLTTSLSHLPTPPEQATYWTDRMPFLADLLGLEASDNEFTKPIVGRLRRNNTFALIERILHHQLKQHPILILLEDIHWADELSLALVKYLVNELVNCPLFFVLVHRPLAAHDQTGLTSLKSRDDCRTIHLEPFSIQESLDLVKILLGHKPLSPEARDLLLKRGQGNPFFLHEITSTLSDGIEIRNEQSLEFPEPVKLPDTVQDVILSRVDRLSESEKFTLKVASVIGPSFQRSLLSEVHPVHEPQFQLSKQLDTLEHEKLLNLEIPAPQWEYTFRHVIAQEVVYEGLLLTQRRQLHTAVGAALEDLAPDEVERLAFHYRRSENLDKAIYYLRLAAEKSQREYANQAAIAHYSEILSCLADCNEGNLISTYYWDILLERTRLYNLTGQRDEELEDLGTLGIIAEALQDNYRRALAAKQWVYLYETSGDYDSGLELIERAVILAQEAGHEKLVGEGYNHWGKLLYLRGDFKTAHHYLQQALLIAQGHQNRSVQAECLNNLGLVAHYQADYDVALYLFQEAIDVWKETGDQVGRGNSICNLGRVYYDQSQFITAEQLYHQSADLHRKIGDRAGEALAQYSLGKIQRSLGNYAMAEDLFYEALRFYRSIGDRHREALSLCELGFLYHRQASFGQAINLLENTIGILRELEDPWGLSRALSYYAWTLHGQSRPGEARNAVTEALRLKRETQQEIARMEDLAILGRIALTIDDLSLADSCVQNVLNFINRQGIQGIEHPAMVFLTCYHIFQAVENFKEAQSVLAKGEAYIDSQASQITDPVLRDSYLKNIPENCELKALLSDKVSTVLSAQA